MTYFSTLLRTCLLLDALGIASCQPPTCQLRSIKTLAVVQTMYDNGQYRYVHYVLLDGFSRECLDSAAVVTLATNYRDTVVSKKPVSALFFYSSAARFTPGGVPSVPHLDADCLVKIGYDGNTSTPRDFIFHTGAGDVSYWGNRWFKKKTYRWFSKKEPRGRWRR